MIATLNGILFLKQADRIIVDVRGVGYEAMVSGRTYDGLPSAGEEVFLYIYTSVREDAITLYAFSEQQEKELFLLLNTVSGVGPKLALAILSGIAVAEFCQAISLKDMDRLTAISGVGKKTAQRLCMELGEKVVSLAAGSSAPVTRVSGPAVAEGFGLQDAASALINLGYPQNMAWHALRTVQQQDPEAAAAMKVEELIRQALRALA